MLTTGLLARLCGPRVGLLAGAFYGTMLFPLAFVQSPVHDVALVPWVNLAILWFWEAERAMRGLANHLLAILKIGAVLGLACLTKGLSGVAVIGLTYGGYLVLVREQCFTATGGDGATAAAQPPLAPILLRGGAGAGRCDAAGRPVVCAHGAAQSGLSALFLFGASRAGLRHAKPDQAPHRLVLPAASAAGRSTLDRLSARGAVGCLAHARDRDWRPVLLLLVWLVGGMVFFSMWRNPEALDVHLAAISPGGRAGRSALGGVCWKAACRQSHGGASPPRFAFLAGSGRWPYRGQ